MATPNDGRARRGSNLELHNKEQKQNISSFRGGRSELELEQAITAGQTEGSTAAATRRGPDSDMVLAG